jgi:hypothetical protein
LFSKHISIEEQQQLLTSGKTGKYINVYVGVPNRIRKLIEVGTIKAKNSSLQSIIVDTHLNAKNFSIFDIYETRDDTFDIFMMC